MKNRNTLISRLALGILVLGFVSACGSRDALTVEPSWSTLPADVLAVSGRSAGVCVESFQGIPVSHPNPSQFAPLCGAMNGYWDDFYRVCRPRPMTAWHCATHSTANGGFRGAVSMNFYDPLYPGGITIAARPGSGHCTGVAVRLELVALRSGKSVALPCPNQSGGSCKDGLFDIPVQSSPSWRLSVFDTAGVVSRNAAGIPIPDTYYLRYDWVENSAGPGATCTVGQDSYRIGLFLGYGDEQPATPVSEQCDGF